MLFLNEIFIIYIDPSTGSMLFAMLLGLVSTVIFGLKTLLMKIKYGGAGVKKFLDADKTDVVIYSDHKRYDNVFLPILNELEKRNIKTIFYSMSSDDPIFDNDFINIKASYIESNAKGFNILNNINSKICVSTTPGLDVYQWKRSKHCDKYIHIYHSLEPNAAGYRMFGIDFYDILLTPSDYMQQFVRELEVKRNEKSKELVTVGVTYMDSMLERIKNTTFTRSEVPLVLVAPSWGDTSLLNKYGSKFIDSLVKTGYNIVIRPHPQSLTHDSKLINELKEKYKKTNNLSWNFDNDNFDILNKSDILISDFSNVVFDYLFIFGKPLIYTEFNKDKNCYDEWWLDNQYVYEDIFADVGYELKEEMFTNMKEVIDDALSNNAKKSNIEKWSNIIWNNKGKSAISIVDELETIIQKS